MSIKNITYDTAVVGQILGQTRSYATRESIRAYAEAMDDSDPIYWDEASARAAGYPGVVAPPGYHLQYTNLKVAVGERGYLPRGSIHSRSQYRLSGFVLAGDCLTTTVSVGDKFEKKGRKYLVYHVVVSNQREEILCTHDYFNLLGEEA